MRSSFAEAERRPDDEKAAGNTLCIGKAFEDVWAFFLPVKTVCVLVNRGYHPQTKHFVESGSAPEDRDESLSVITSSDMKKQLFGKTE